MRFGSNSSFVDLAVDLAVDSVVVAVGPFESIGGCLRYWCCSGN